MFPTHNSVQIAVPMRFKQWVLSITSVPKTLDDVPYQLNLFIYYSNPIGITGCTVNIATGTATAGTPFLQTFNVQFFSVIRKQSFLWNDLISIASEQRIDNKTSTKWKSWIFEQCATPCWDSRGQHGNVGWEYFPFDEWLNSFRSSQIPFTVFQAPFNGLCNQTVRRTVLFRENIQTVCRFR